MAWNTQKNRVFFERISNVAYQLQSIDEEIRRLSDIYVADGVAASPEFVDANNLTVADINAMVQIAAAYRAFLDNGAVATADRRASVARVLAARQA